MEQRCFDKSYDGSPRVALQLQEAVFSKKKKSSYDCPIGNYNIMRRSSEEEKYFVLAKQRIGHVCEYKWIVIIVIAWDGISENLANDAYIQFSSDIGTYGKDVFHLLQCICLDTQ